MQAKLRATRGLGGLEKCGAGKLGKILALAMLSQALGN